MFAPIALLKKPHVVRVCLNRHLIARSKAGKLDSDGLFLIEVAALRIYSSNESSGIGQMNEGLWKQSSAAEWLALPFASALNRLPKFVGTRFHGIG